MSEYAACYDLQDELGRLDQISTKRAERLRDLEGRRLDRLTLALEPGVRIGDPRAITTMDQVMERCAKLVGLDAPTTSRSPGPTVAPAGHPHGGDAV